MANSLARWQFTTTSVHHFLFFRVTIQRAFLVAMLHGLGTGRDNHAMNVPWPIRSVVAGSAGTASMTMAYDIKRRLRRGHRGPLDYDDSLVPGQIVASIVHLGHVTGREENELGLGLRWS